MARARIPQALTVAGFGAGLVLALFVVAAPAFADNEAPERALCVVCQVDEGAIAPEPVRATRTHGEHTIHFCSERCARIFEKDPHKYLDALAAAKPAGGSPGDSLFALGQPGGGHVSTPPT